MSTAKIDVMTLFAKSLKSPYTRKGYTEALQKYQKYAGIKQPEELLTLGQDSVISFLLKLEDAGMSYSSKQNAVAAIKHFYEMNDIVFNWKKINRFIGEAKKTIEDRPYTADEIKKILDKCDERERVIVLTLASTGMRLGGLVESRIEGKKFPGIRIKNMTKTPHGIYKIRVYDEDVSKHHITFCSYECTLAIDSYLEFRKRCGERIGPESPLIRNQFNKNKQEEAENAKPMATHGTQMIIYYLLLDSGLRKKPTESDAFKRKDVMMVHGFRKFFSTQLNEAYKNEKPFMVELLMGHDTGLVGVYNMPSEEAREDFYLGGMDALTIDDTHRLQKQVKVLEVKAKAGEKVEALEKIVADSSLKHEAITKQMAELAEKNRRMEERQALYDDLLSDPSKLKKFLEDAR